MAFNRLFFGLIIICLLLMLPAAIAAEEEIITVTGIRLDKTEMVMGLNEREELRATVYPWNASNRAVSWSSSDSAVVMLEPSGHTANLIPQSTGETTITARTIDQGFQIQCFVTVIIRVQSIGIDQEELTLSPGEKSKLEVRVAPREATEQGINWRSTDPGVATVTEEGEVEALREGNARIIASSVEDDKITVFSTVTVTEEGDEPVIPPPVNGETPPIDPEPQPETASNLFIYIIGGLAVLLIILLFLFVLTRKRSAVQPSVPLQAAPPGQQIARPLLVGLSGTYAGQVVEFSNNQATIGRDSSAQAVYPPENTEISRIHCTVTFDPVLRHFTIVDTSSNGTFWINGERLQQYQQYNIEPGDRFSLSESNETFTVELE